MLVIRVDFSVAVPVFVAYIAYLCTRLNQFTFSVLVVFDFFHAAEDTVCFNQVEVRHGMSFLKHVDTASACSVSRITGDRHILSAGVDFSHLVVCRT